MALCCTEDWSARAPISAALAVPGLFRQTICKVSIVVGLSLAAPAFAVGKGSVKVSDAPSPDRLKPSGRWLVDSEGRVVIVRGVNMVNKTAETKFEPSAAGFSEEDASLLRAEGFNAVRLGVIYSAVEPSPGTYDEGYIQSIRETVAMLSRYGIRSLLDFHQDLYGPAFGSAGFPRWASVARSKCAKSPCALPVLEAFQSFWDNKAPVSSGSMGLHDRYAAAWRHVALRFAQAPGVLGYEIINEPYPGLLEVVQCLHGCSKFDGKTLSPFYDKVAASIRSADPTTLIFFEPNVLFDLGTPSFVEPPKQQHVVFSFHPYGCQEFASVCSTFGVKSLLANRKSSVQTILKNAEAYARSHSGGDGVALVATEWGAFTTCSKSEVEVASEIVDGANDLDSAMMSWFYWTWANKTPFPIPCRNHNNLTHGEDMGLVANLSQARTAGNLKGDRLNALVRPYPKAVAGTPGSWSYDANQRVFRLSYAPVAVSRRALAASAETEIFVPNRHYPTGYRVIVEGAKVISPPGASDLRIANLPGSAKVLVVVTPE